MRFTLFKDRAFEVKDPEALIESYCFQNRFYAKYDMHRPEGDRSFEYVGSIGARIKAAALEQCKTQIKRYESFNMFEMDLDSFLDETLEVRDQLVSKLGELAGRLDSIPGVGFSKATKVLHTRYPKIIPIIDNQLQREYEQLCKGLKRDWKKGDWSRLFKDYYDNFLVKETYNNLCELHSNLSLPGLTKVRVFDILWWSYLRSKDKDYKGIDWRTIKSVD